MKIFTGKVIANKMAKTATVAVERIVAHPLYKKRIRRIKKYHVNDTLGVEVGNTVHFVASKPFSKLKKWNITEVVGVIDKVGNKKVVAKNKDRQTKRKIVVKQ